MVTSVTSETSQANGDKDKRQNHRFVKLGGQMAGVALGAVLGAGFAVSAVPTHVTLGPVEASVKIVPSNVISETLVGEDTLKATQPSPYKIIGARLEVTNLNADLSSLTVNPSGSTSAAETSAFAQLFTNLDHDKEVAVQKIQKQAAIGAAGGAAVAATLIFGAPYARRRRQKSNPELHDAWETIQFHYSRKLKIAGVIAGSTILVAGGANIADQETQKVRPDGSFQTFGPLAQTELSGSVAPLVKTSVDRITGIVTANSNFYSDVTKNLQGQFTPEYAAGIPEEKNIVPILLVSDRHCNVGMDPVFAELAKLYKTQLAISAGDDNFSGTYPFEFACTSGFASYLSASGIPFTSVTGNHDSSKTSDPNQNFNTENWEKAQGIQVLTGAVQEIKLANGSTIRLLGSSDPRRSRLGKGIVPSDEAEQERLVAKQGEVLGATACESKDSVDMVVTHDPRSAESAIASSCGNIYFAASGHTHSRQSPTLAGNAQNGQLVYRIVEGTSGGAKEDTPTFGPLKAPATADIIYWDSDTRQPIGTVSITTMPDGTVQLGQYTPLPNNLQKLTSKTKNNILSKNKP